MSQSSSNKKALITGIAGQDGSYLAELLLSKGYKVFGLVQPKSNTQYVPQGADITYSDISNPQCIKTLVERTQPDEVYNLAGITDLKTAFAQPELTMKINCESVGALLNESIKINPRAHFLQASSSEMFLPSPTSLTEESPRDWETKNPYAKAKMMADRDFILPARESKNKFACSAILFNHESPRSHKSRVLKKITRTLIAIMHGTETCLHIGNIEMRRDWGFAGDYTDAMWSMLQLDAPEDLIIATGKTHSVKDVINITAELLGLTLSWQGEGVGACAYDSAGRKVVAVDPDFYKPTEKYPKVGDARKAEQIIGWKAQTKFQMLIKLMVDDALNAGSQ